MAVLYGLNTDVNVKYLSDQVPTGWLSVISNHDLRDTTVIVRYPACIRFVHPEVEFVAVSVRHDFVAHKEWSDDSLTNRISLARCVSVLGRFLSRHTMRR